MGSGGTWVPQCVVWGDAERVAAGLGADPGRAPTALEEAQLFGTVSALESWQGPGWQARGALPDGECYPMGVCSCPHSKLVLCFLRQTQRAKTSLAENIQITISAAAWL